MRLKRNRDFYALRQAVAACLGYSVEELDEMGRVAVAFSEERRRWDVPWSAYVAVLGYSKEVQDMLLDYHESHGRFPDGDWQFKTSILTD